MGQLFPAFAVPVEHTIAANSSRDESTRSAHRNLGQEQAAQQAAMIHQSRLLEAASGSLDVQAASTIKAETVVPLPACVLNEEDSDDVMEEQEDGQIMPVKRKRRPYAKRIVWTDNMVQELFELGTLKQHCWECVYIRLSNSE